MARHVKPRRVGDFRAKLPVQGKEGGNGKASARVQGECKTS